MALLPSFRTLLFRAGLLISATLSVAAADRPNIVYILADDLGEGDLSCYNDASKIPTPQLDRLARQGMRFTDAHASDSVCTPSRYGILTGRYSFRSWLKRGVIVPWGDPLIETDRLTVPGFLRQEGYATAAIGKWHLGWTWPTKDGRPPDSKNGTGNIDFAKPIAHGPVAVGFDTFFGVDLPNYPPYAFIQDDHTVGIPTIPAALVKGGINRPGPMMPGWSLSAVLPEVTAHAVRYVENAAAHKNQPFFLYFAMTAPHYPIVPTPEFKGKSKAGEYGDYVTEVDAMVGRVLDALERTAQASNTLVIFSSDNGPEVLEVLSPNAYDRIRVYDHDSMDGLRGVKRDAWEGGHRIPFVARWPGHVPAGATTASPVCEIDLMATCAAILHTPLPTGAGEDSCNILPLLLGQPSAPERAPIILHSLDGKFGIRQGEWVFIDAPTGTGNGPKGQEPDWFKKLRGYEPDSFPGELYNLKDDRPQRHNLYGEHPELVKQFKAQLASYEEAGKKTDNPGAKSTPQE